ncbi:hypothetical protein D3C86_1720260 [compost metagenome]
MWTSHTYKSCAKSKVILINGNWFVETKPKKKDNPRGWICTDDSNVIINPSDEILLNLEVIEKVFYDKKNVEFNVKRGSMIIFNESGCYVVEKTNK